jgi:hypothetical protein
MLFVITTAVISSHNVVAAYGIGIGGDAVDARCIVSAGSEHVGE